MAGLLGVGDREWGDDRDDLGLLFGEHRSELGGAGVLQRGDLTGGQGACHGGVGDGGEPVEEATAMDPLP